LDLASEPSFRICPPLAAHLGQEVHDLDALLLVGHPVGKLIPEKVVDLLAAKTAMLGKCRAYQVQVVLLVEGAVQGVQSSHSPYSQSQAI